MDLYCGCIVGGVDRLRMINEEVSSKVLLEPELFESGGPVFLVPITAPGRAARFLLVRQNK